MACVDPTRRHQPTATATGCAFSGNAKLVGVQALGVLAASAYAALVTFVILKVIGAIVGLRVEKNDELEGLDATVHGESGYVLGSNNAHAARADEEGDEPATATVSAPAPTA